MSYTATVTGIGNAKMIYLAGVGAEDENGARETIRHPGNFIEQCKYAYDKIKRVLMSGASDQSLRLILSGQFDEAGRLAANAVKQDPYDWHAHYAVGQFFRITKDYTRACSAYSRANELQPRQPTILLGLAIARQQNGEYDSAIDALRVALEIDADDVFAYNTLAMTQKLMGAYEKAAHNYDEGAKALARVIVKSLRNEEGSSRLPHWNSRSNLWSQYAMFGAINLAASASVEKLAWPTWRQKRQLVARSQRLHATCVRIGGNPQHSRDHQ